jgi:hypothetical protein
MRVVAQQPCLSLAGDRPRPVTSVAQSRGLALKDEQRIHAGTLRPSSSAEASNR